MKLNPKPYLGEDQASTGQGGMYWGYRSKKTKRRQVNTEKSPVSPTASEQPSTDQKKIEERLVQIEKMIEILPDRLIQALTHGGGHA